MELPPFLWPATVLAVCAIAVWRGGSYERLAAGGLLAGWALTMAVYRSGFQETEWGILAVDLSLLLLLVWIALRSDAWWPLFAAGFHLLAVATHLANIVDTKVGAWAYLTAEIIWGYLLAFSIGLGAWRSRGRQPAARAAPIAEPGATRR